MPDNMTYKEWEKAFLDGGKKDFESVDKSAESGIIRDKRITQAVESGSISLELNPEKQNPHIYGSPAYNEKRRKSYFTIPIEEVQGIVKRYHGTGNVLVKRTGQIKTLKKLKLNYAIEFKEVF